MPLRGLIGMVAVWKDRIDTAIALYNEGVATRIIMSGDIVAYNKVAMALYAG